MSRFLSILVVAASLPLPAAAQAQEGSGEIAGYVRAAGTNRAVLGTMLTLSSDAGEIIQQTTPEGGGRFVFSNIRRGVYYVTAKAPGYREATQRADLISIRRITLHLNLVPEEGSPPQPLPEPAMVSEALLRAPKNALKEFERGRKELLDKRHPQASLPHFEKALQLYPEFYEAAHLEGTALMDLEKWPEAEQALRRSLALNQKYAPSCAALGALYNRQGRSGEAAPLLKRAIALDPTLWQAHFELAQALLAKRKVADAETHARRAHELEPRNPLAHILLGNIGLARGDRQAARQEYQHFLDLAPAHPLAADVRAKLSQLDAPPPKSP